ncbi:trehalose-phosphatase [Neorhizobium sp. JUb45]|uniref:trehalose-phosphatase n=1 Tax=unclassified Neorhizobium TaxID=2629175 RepID=UPI00104ECF8D|nr:trehalose-phosphatase [Neorhizobium sp. JUb45]TCR01988.1 trehalose 6-phosphatase [Neorhizobium sp. JUb45]
MSQQEKSREATHAGGFSPSAAAVFDLLGDLDRFALFLDIDGTLIDLAATPDGIVVPPELPTDIAAVSQKLGGALALVTGRALAYADRLFEPQRFPIAGLHGAERRMADGTVDRVTVTPEFEALKAQIAAEASRWHGVLIEDKGAAVGAHYRQAPERQADLENLMQAAATKAGGEFALQRGKMVIELRPARASKGEAIKRFLDEPPFTGRLPITIGDDLTDEAMFKAANQLGGHSIRIGDATLPDGSATAATMLLSSAQELRDILSGLAR